MTPTPRFRTLAILTVALCILTIGASSARPPDPELAPPVPTGVQASDGLYVDKVRITWNASAGAEYYNVYRTPYTASEGTKIGSSFSTSYDDYGSTPGTLFYYRVDACVTGSCSAKSGPDTGYEKLAAPVVSATDGTDLSRVRVTWGAISGAESYTVYRGDDSHGYDETWPGVLTTYYNDYDADPGVIYYYWVRAVSTDPNTQSNTGQDTGYRNFTAPTGVSASDGIYTALVAVTWNTVTGATRYQVFRDGAKIGIAGAGTYSDYAAVLGTMHAYRVKACNLDESICGDLSTHDTGYRKLYAPTGVSATDGTYSDKVRITWNAATGAAFYKVFKSISEGGLQTEIGSPSTTTFDDVTGVAGMTYWYRVTSCNPVVGCSDPSAADPGYRSNPTATPTRRPTNTPGATPTRFPGTVPRIFMPILMK